MRALKFITVHVIYNPAYTYKFQLKTTFRSTRHSMLRQDLNKKWKARELKFLKI